MIVCFPYFAPPASTCETCCQPQSFHPPGSPMLTRCDPPALPCRGPCGTRCAGLLAHPCFFCRHAPLNQRVPSISSPLLAVHVEPAVLGDGGGCHHRHRAAGLCRLCAHRGPAAGARGSVRPAVTAYCCPGLVRRGYWALLAVLVWQSPCSCCWWCVVHGRHLRRTELVRASSGAHLLPTRCK